MALINCPECEKKVSDKAYSCPECGFPIKDYMESKIEESKETKNEPIAEENIEELDSENKVFSDSELDMLYESENGKRILMIQKISCDLDFNSAKKVVDDYFKRKFPEKELHYTKQMEISHNTVSEKKAFSGVYRATLFGGMQEVYCPTCGSENCSHYKEQKIIPGKTKTTYSANLNPFKPFTLVNKKEKVVRKDQVYTENKFICNRCGKIFY